MIVWSVSTGGLMLLMVMTLPIMLLLASTGTSMRLSFSQNLLMVTRPAAIGIVYSIEVASPSGLYGEATVTFLLPYFALSLTLNVLLTIMIGGRIWLHRGTIKNNAHKEEVERYTNITSIFVESAALYAVSNILLLGTFASGNPISQIWLAVTPSIQVRFDLKRISCRAYSTRQLISNYLIIYRIAIGSAWSAKVVTENQTFQSDPAAQSTIPWHTKDNVYSNGYSEGTANEYQLQELGKTTDDTSGSATPPELQHV